MPELQIDFSKSQKQIMMLIVVSSLIALIAYFNFLLKPQMRKVFSTVSMLNKSQNDLRSAQADIANIDKYKNDISMFEEKVDRYEKMLPAEQEIPSLLESLSTIAKNSNIKIVGITPTALREGSGARDRVYQEIPILISAKSGYNELGRFLSSLENSDRFMKVADIEIRSNRVMPKKHDVELLVLTYVLPKNK